MTFSSMQKGLKFKASLFFSLSERPWPSSDVPSLRAAVPSMDEDCLLSAAAFSLASQGCGGKGPPTPPCPEDENTQLARAGTTGRW